MSAILCSANRQTGNLEFVYCVRFDISKENYTRYYNDYVELYVTTVRAIVLEEDPSRPFVTSSPSNGIDTVTEGWVAKDPQSTRYGDSKSFVSLFSCYCATGVFGESNLTPRRGKKM